MAFIYKLIGPDEELIGIARLHWIYGIQGLMWLAGCMLVGGLINWGILSLFGGALSRTAMGGFLVLGNAVFWISLALGLSLFTFYFIMMLSTEIGLTTTRLIYKKGLIFVETEGIDLEEIKGAFVDNEIFGRMLNYGTIRFDARFIRDMTLPAVADPYRFVKALNDRRSEMKEEGMHIFLDGPGANKTDALRHAIDLSQSAQPPPRRLQDAKYKSFEDVEPMAMFDDLVQETRENVYKLERDAAPNAPTIFKPRNDRAKGRPSRRAHGKKPKGRRMEEATGPILISELKEEVIGEFEAKSTRQ